MRSFRICGQHGISAARLDRSGSEHIGLSLKAATEIPEGDQKSRHAQQKHDQLPIARKQTETLELPVHHLARPCGYRSENHEKHHVPRHVAVDDMPELMRKD